MHSLLMGLALAVSGPVYLECEITETHTGNIRHLDVTLNEATETAGYTVRETGFSSSKLSAVFAPNKVTIKEPDSMFDTVLEVDRSTLTVANITRTRDYSERKVLRDDRGQCSIPKLTKERQF